MKKILFIASLAIAFVACKNNDKKAVGGQLTPEQIEKSATDTANFTSIQWLDSTYLDLGKITKDQSIEISFRFKNVGTKNLVIENVSAQCGCTIPEKPAKAFAPGEEGVIKAKFNGSGHGQIRKEVYVTANTNGPNPYTLTFGGEIVEKN